MERWASRTFSVCLLILLLRLNGSKGRQCDNGWFGDKCQYQCHCLDNAVCNQTTGDCPERCDKKWFGPQCQYWDAAFTTNNVSLTDGDNSTCLSPDGSLSQNFTMSKDVMLTWMRFVTKVPGLFDRVNMTFLSSSGDKVDTKSPLTKVYLSDTILDLYGELQDRFKTISLDFDSTETKQSFCSMQVSSGRNVALKQNASQTSTYPGGEAAKAVDGNFNESWFGHSCTSTKSNISQYWTLNLSLPVNVNMYTIQGRSDDDYSCIRLYFQLKTYYNSQQVQEYNYIDVVNGSYSDDVYPSVNISAITSVELTVSKNSFRGNANCAVSFCEMQIYGDVMCQQRNWGRDCEKDCNCQNATEKCFVSTGMCSSGCKAGFYGLGCEKECDPGFHGYNCSQTCPKNCLNNTCDNVNGTCVQCEAGYRGPKCNQECDKGSYGYNCSDTCPENCLNNTCNNINGTCINCEPGYQGPLCNQECDKGSYGYNCSDTCPENCLDNTCNNINGTCINCEPGYQGPLCNQACANGTYGKGCNKMCSVNCVMNATHKSAICGHVNGKCLLGCLSGYIGITCEEISSESDEVNLVIIVVPIVLMLSAAAALIFGIWLWRRRKVQKTEREGTVHGPIDEPNDELGNDGNYVESEIKANISTDYLNPDTSPYEMAREIREDEVNVYVNTPEMQVRFSETAIAVESLGEYLASHDMDFFTEQFQKVPECTATTKAAESSVNMHKNRYKNILAYDHSRVRLREDTEKKQGDYYNANFIQGFDGAKYIAAQAPNHGVLADFIRMIWEQEVELVVMLTKLAEEGKAKCECYWPINDSTEVTFGEITVKLAATQDLADYTKRTFQLIKNDGQSHCVTHYHFTSWPDKGVPQTPWALVDFEQVVDYHYDTEKPLLVHCSAGVGRTGTFIALRNVLKEAKVTGYIDFYQTLAKMRQDRIFMIQTVEQYCFLHDAARVALLCQDALMTSEALDKRMRILMEVTETGETNMEKEFKMVCALVEKDNGDDSEKETLEYVNCVEIDQNFMTNIKNRFANILAKNEHRPKLAGDLENEYINAVLVPSMIKQQQQVLTQLPLPNTVEDFWRLVSQYNVSLIVAFDTDQQNQKKPIGHYLPQGNKSLKCGKLEITGDKVTLGAFWEKQKIHVQVMSRVKDPCNVHHIKCTKFNLDIEDWLLLIKELHSMAPLGDTRTLYMCMNGADQSGFACVVSLLIRRVEHDHFLTVPLVVGEIKSIRPEVIPNRDQYCSLYKILQLHCEMASVYTNHTPHSTH